MDRPKLYFRGRYVSARWLVGKNGGYVSSCSRFTQKVLSFLPFHMIACFREASFTDLLNNPCIPDCCLDKGARESRMSEEEMGQNFNNLPQFWTEEHVVSRVKQTMREPTMGEMLYRLWVGGGKKHTLYTWRTKMLYPQSMHFIRDKLLHSITVKKVVQQRSLNAITCSIGIFWQ